MDESILLIPEVGLEAVAPGTFNKKRASSHWPVMLVGLRVVLVPSVFSMTVVLTTFTTVSLR